MDVKGILLADVEAELAGSLKERQAFDIAYGPADFNKDDICPGNLSAFLYALFYFVGNVRNDLNGLAKVITPPFARNYRIIYLTLVNRS